MRFYADLHIHSYYSRATSKHLKLEYLQKWAQLKGIQVVGTGDCIHPGWLEELKEKLVPAEDGLYQLKPEYAAVTEAEVPGACKGPVRFLLTAEISNIYKRLDRVRKVHNVIFMPSFQAAETVQSRLDAIGNIRSDGRPILGLDSRDLLEIVLESDPMSFLVPAHIWTPWFSALGSKGGFDRITDCFGDLSAHIFAVETGLSSDPPMNWRLSQLDPYILISNSDAHSPQKLGREASIFDTTLSYYGIYQALSSPGDNGLKGTIEFYPEEGKYHFDGHRKCNIRLHPSETIRHKGNCPICGKPVTVGVMARVEELADREANIKPPRWRPYHSLIPLVEVIAETRNVGPNSKRVKESFSRILNTLGNEISILKDRPISDIEDCAGSMLAEAIQRMRDGRIDIAAGYDGEYGMVRIFSQDEREQREGMLFQLDRDPLPTPARISCAVPNDTVDGATELAQERPSTVELDGDVPHTDVSELLAEESTGYVAASGCPSLREASDAGQPTDVNKKQWDAITYRKGHLLIKAGPGTGKTHTLTHRIARLTESVEPAQIVAITFTHKAADEMEDRLRQRLGDRAASFFVGTFHQFCLKILRRHGNAVGITADFEVATAERVGQIAVELWPSHSVAQRRTILQEISTWKSFAVGGQAPDYIESFNCRLRRERLLDFDDLLLEAVNILKNEKEARHDVCSRHRHLFVDEYQDINRVQHALLEIFVREGATLTAIGDPNQAIYSFRGSNAAYFDRFCSDFAGAKTMELAENYRSAPTILTASSQLLEEGEGNIRMPEIVPTLHSRGRLTVHCAPTSAAEAEYVVHEVEKLVGGTAMFSYDTGRVDSGVSAIYSFGDVAVLVRTRMQLRILGEAFARSGMPYMGGEERTLLEQPGVGSMVSLVQLVSGLKLPVDVLAELCGWYLEGIGEKRVARLVQEWGGRDQCVSLDRFVQILDTSPVIKACAAGTGQEWCRELERLRSLYGDRGLSALVEELKNIVNWNRLESQNRNLQESWARLLRCSRRSSDLKTLLDVLSLQEEHDAIGYESERITLGTLHSSKGLEFGVVFIVGCDDQHLPLRRDDDTIDQNEERRLFYVGMTRSRDLLYLVRAKQVLVYGRTVETEPSSFLSDIEEKLKTYERIARQAMKRSAKVDRNQPLLFSHF